MPPFFEHRRRRSIRLPGWDYSTPGAYFVTICIEGRECILGEVRDGAMILSPYGQVVEEHWRRLPRFFPRIELDAFVVMPNHVHGVIVIKDAAASPEHVSASDAATSAPAPSPPVALPCVSPLRCGKGVTAGDGRTVCGTQPGSLGAIVQSFKSITARRINRMCRAPGAHVWQVNYYEHIVRDQGELERTRRYIVTNPERWGEDEENPLARVRRSIP